MYYLMYTYILKIIKSYFYYNIIPSELITLLANKNTKVFKYLNTVFKYCI